MLFLLTLGVEGFAPTSEVAPDTLMVVEVDPWFGPDKLWHWAMSLTLVGSSYHLTRCRLDIREPIASGFAISFTLACGLLKELCDLKRPRGRFSCRDLLYNGLGVGMGYLLFIHQFRR